MTAEPKTSYDQKFYDQTRSGSVSSARSVVPIILPLVRPNSVVDVGCGVGAWLRVFEEHGVTDYLGLDGSYIDRNQLAIDQCRFQAVDLQKTPSIPVTRTFDLAVCLEVAEHLSARSADGLISFLTTLSPCVLFSAAVPGQQGTDHVNEQWPSYWSRLFERKGYVRLDPVRPRVWRDPGVEWWYKQNLYLFCRPEVLAANADLREEAELAAALPFELLHHDVFGSLMTLRGAFRHLLRVTASFFVRAIGRGR